MPRGAARGTVACAPEISLAAPVALRSALGKSRRKACPRDALDHFQAADRDPIEVIEASNRHRLRELIPIRYGRMAHSPLSFFRGAAALMARDIGPAPSPGIRAQVCGDCHLANFGGFASPERRLLFGVNDFDETLPGFFEWDLKRLAASFVVAARDSGFRAAIATRIARRALRSYREHIIECATVHAIDLWYLRIDLDTLIETARSKATRAERQALAQRALRHTADHVSPKLIEEVDGQPRIRDRPPLIYHTPRLSDLHDDVIRFWNHYVESMPDERRILLARYRLADVAIKVVGVGSVGTRCAVALLIGAQDEPLFLQFKEAQRSVYEAWAGPSPYANHGQRVVVGQRIMQAASDIFLGFAHAPHLNADFYVRQLRDMKISFVSEPMAAEEMLEYADACGWALALAHAKGSDPAQIAAYLGRGSGADDALVRFAVAYADQNDADFARLLKAIRAGRIKADLNESSRPDPA